MQLYNPDDPKGGHGPMAPLLNAPLVTKRSWLLIERIKEQPIARQRAAESALPSFTNNYTKMFAAHFCNTLFSVQFF